MGAYFKSHEMDMIRPRLYGDVERWQQVLDQIRNRSKILGDNEDVLFLENLLKDIPVEQLTTEDKIQADRRVRGLTYQLKEHKEKYKKLIDSYDDLQSIYDASLAFENIKTPKEIKIIEKDKRQSVIFLQASDWHVEERVEKINVNGLNEYNPTIARKRVEILSNNTVALIKKESSFSNISDIVIHLGGDFINGWIHEENRETNTMSPIEATDFATELLIQYLTVIQKTGIPLTIVCNVGNHGRFTNKMRFSNIIQTNFETLLFSTIIRHFGNDINVVMAGSNVAYHTVLGEDVRFYHGHEIRYSNGVGGLSIPLNKWEHKQDQTRFCHFNFMGHYHQCSMPNSKTVLNGSLVGYNAYAQAFGFSYEPPQQSMIVRHAEFGWTSFNKVLAV